MYRARVRSAIEGKRTKAYFELPLSPATMRTSVMLKG